MQLKRVCVLWSHIVARTVLVPVGDLQSLVVSVITVFTLLM